MTQKFHRKLEDWFNVENCSHFWLKEVFLQFWENDPRNIFNWVKSLELDVENIKKLHLQG